MFNTKQYNMNNKTFTPSAELKSINVQFSNKAQLGRPVDPNSKRQQRLATAPGKKTGRPVNPNTAIQRSALCLCNQSLLASAVWIDWTTGFLTRRRCEPLLASTVWINRATQLCLVAELNIE